MRCDDINGAVIGTGSKVEVESVKLILSHEDAFALCNLLHISNLTDTKGRCTKDQEQALIKIGRDLGVLVDHPSRDNLGKLEISVADPE